MKKLVTYMLLLVAGLMSGCNNQDDPIFDDPDERLTAALTEYKKAIVEAPNGWKATIYPKGGKGFSYYMTFNEAGRVKMLSDFNSTTAETVSESSFRLKALQRPTLIFDTYNYIHMPHDPNASISGGTTGAGLTSDFQFAFKTVKPDTILLEGTVNGNQMLMVKATAAEANWFNTGELKKFISKAENAVKGSFPYLELDGVKIPFSLSVGTKNTGLLAVDANNKIVQSNSPFSFTTDGLDLKQPVTFGNYSFKKIFWDDAQGKFYVFAGANKIYFQNSAAPLPLAVNPPLHTILGKDYTSMQINVASLPDLSADFLQAYNTANTSLGTLGNAGRYIEYITILFNPNNQVIFQIRYRNPSSPSSFFLADFIYNMTLDANGVAKFTLAAAPAGNANTIRTYVVALTDYFANNEFKIAYIAAGAPGGSTVGAFLNQTNPASYFYGILIR